jgi:hypothetical protein
MDGLFEIRSPFESERIVIAYLLDLAGISRDASSLLVRPTQDGGMGSLAFAPFEHDRAFGSEAAECHFYDVDGVPVSVALNLDKEGRLFELDVWRVDFRPTVRWPHEVELYAGPPKADGPDHPGGGA